MSSLISRIKELKNELEKFPIGDCSPSDDPDKQTAYLYSYREIVKRFTATAKRLDNQELLQLISALNTEPESISEAYDLKAELFCVLDYIDDLLNDSEEKLKTKPTISPEIVQKLSNIICESLASESANHLHIICENYGLTPGTREEAFSGKNSYVYKRLAHFNANDLWELAKKMRGKYPASGLDELIYAIENSDHLSIEAKFENIKERIISEIKKAKYFIWVAVAWFTDRDIANELYRKKQQGLNVQIIVNDDEINSALCSKFDNYFENHKIPSGKKYKNIMHHKFCVIDMKTVIHGSYNWTVKAQYNKETITVSEGRDIAEKFAEEFIGVKQKIMNENK